MFNHTDPVETGVLAAHGALQHYRETLDSFYRFAARFSQTRFVTLAQLPADADRETIPWIAFPQTAPVTDARVDSERWNWQDEYVEWRVVRGGDGGIEQIVVTTEFVEYYQALAEVSADALIAGIQDSIPGADPTIDELFGNGFDPDDASSEARAARFRANTVVPFNAPPNTVPPNPWNNGTKGILCLMQKFNTMGALFNLAGQCAVPNTSIPASSQCAAVGGACGPNRSSDPRICERAQAVSRIPRSLSLADPVGIRITGLSGRWAVDGNEIDDINDSTSNQGVWIIDRNGRRGTLDLTRRVTLNGVDIITGTQVSRSLDVGADVVSASSDALSPEAAVDMQLALKFDTVEEGRV